MRNYIFAMASWKYRYRATPSNSRNRGSVVTCITINFVVAGLQRLLSRWKTEALMVRPDKNIRMTIFQEERWLLDNKLRGQRTGQGVTVKKEISFVIFVTKIISFDETP